MKAIAALFLFLAGCLMSFAMPFRYNDWMREGSWLGILLATVGIMIFMKISTTPRKGRWRFLSGFFGAFVYFYITFYWLTPALQTYGELSFFVALLGALILSVYCALYFGVWSWICGSELIRTKPPLIHAFLWASAWAGIEVIREFLFTGFPWGEIGYAFAFSPFVARSSALWGVHGLSFFWIFFAAVILLKQVDRKFWGYTSLPIALMLLGSLTAYWSLPKEEDLKPVTIALIQPNIEQDVKWDPDKSEAHLQLLLNMTNQAMEGNETYGRPDLIVWPETAYPYLIRERQKQLPIQSTIPLIVGGVVRDRYVNKNTALLIEGDQVKATYSKVHLVPFGEFVPLQDWVPFGKLVANAGNFVPGAFDQPPLQPSGTHLKLGVLICYEDIFSRHAVQHARSGANLLVNMTNDGWYGKTSALMQHADMSAFQAYQSGLPIVRSTNTGITSFISLENRLDVEPHQRGIFFQQIKVSETPNRTFFSFSYPLLLWIWWILFAIGLLWKKQPTRRIFFRN